MRRKGTGGENFPFARRRANAEGSGPGGQVRTLKVWFGMLAGWAVAVGGAFLFGAEMRLPSIMDLLLVVGSFLVGWALATWLGQPPTQSDQAGSDRS